MRDANDWSCPIKEREGARAPFHETWKLLMPSYRWSRLIPILCVAGTATWSTAASAFQYPPLSDDLNTRHMHRAEDWVGGAFPATDIINQPPADYGPISGMWSRTPDGNPASGDNFRTMQTGPLPGGFSPHGFNGSGMIPPVNQPDHITNNPVFGGNGQMPDSPNSPNGPFSNNATFGPNGLPYGSANRALGVNPWANPYGPPPQMARTARPQTMSSSAAIP
ncbi:MAG TPA: hypothetical protein VK137_16190, partial [Planctomycetaceae bacterium]|nr:hypothetical protein [Planctomycetaceae bacterium]